MKFYILPDIKFNNNRGDSVICPKCNKSYND